MTREQNIVDDVKKKMVNATPKVKAFASAIILAIAFVSVVSATAETITH